MKYYNKGKEVRLRCWTKVQGPGGQVDPNAMFRSDMKFYFPLSAMRTWKIYLQRDPNPNKFYVDESINVWWFEDEQDAIVATLKWGIKIDNPR